MEGFIGPEHQHFLQGTDSDFPRRAEQLQLGEGPADDPAQASLRIEENKGALLIVNDGRTIKVGAWNRGARRLSRARLVTAAEHEGARQENCGCAERAVHETSEVREPSAGTNATALGSSAVL